MRVEFNSLHWDNVDDRMLHAHKQVMQHFSIPINYTNLNVNHGLWLDHIMQNSSSDIVVILEPDCIPINKDRITDYIYYAYRKNTYVGIAQVSNHIPPRTHIYAAPGFYVMPTKVYKQLGSPSFSETRRSDTAEEICYIAEKKGIRYRALAPTFFEKEPGEGLWPLGPLGYYGIGTIFDNAIYHLYQSRMAANIDLFVERCTEVIDGTFSTDRFLPSTILNYEGKIVS